jgi:hypothetical protein
LFTITIGGEVGSLLAQPDMEHLEFLFEGGIKAWHPAVHCLECIICPAKFMYVESSGFNRVDVESQVVPYFSFSHLLDPPNEHCCRCLSRK